MEYPVSKHDYTAITHSIFMIVLIAESKTMTACDRTVTPELLEYHRAVDENKADAIMADIASQSPQEIAERGRLSMAMAIRLSTMAREFPYKRTGQTAIEAFTGVVFKALDPNTLTSGARDFLNRDTRIISSLYGWLRPDDIIKAYRMEYTSKLAPEGKTMSEYWRGQVTVNLLREIEDTGSKAVLNLLPADAAKCVDWKQIKQLAEVCKVDFKELKDGGSFATPHAGRLKSLRGHLLREIAEGGIDNPAELKALTTPQLLPLGTPDYSDHIAFCV